MAALQLRFWVLFMALHLKETWRDSAKNLKKREKSHVRNYSYNKRLELFSLEETLAFSFRYVLVPLPGIMMDSWCVLPFGV